MATIPNCLDGIPRILEEEEELDSGDEVVELVLGIGRDVEVELMRASEFTLRMEEEI